MKGFNLLDQRCRGLRNIFFVTLSLAVANATVYFIEAAVTMYVLGASWTPRFTNNEWVVFVGCVPRPSWEPTDLFPLWIAVALAPKLLLREPVTPRQPLPAAPLPHPGLAAPVHLDLVRKEFRALLRAMVALAGARALLLFATWDYHRYGVVTPARPVLELAPNAVALLDIIIAAVIVAAYALPLRHAGRISPARLRSNGADACGQRRRGCPPKGNETKSIRVTPPSTVGSLPAS